MDEQARPDRPLPRPDLGRGIPVPDADPARRHETAHETAALVLEAGRSGAADVQTLLELGDRVGLDELAALWRRAEPGSLPATLWTLYLLRAWCRRHGEDVARLFRAGCPHAEVSAAIAGLPDPPGPADAAAFLDDLLEAVFREDLATSLHRAAAFCRVIAAGRGDLSAAGVNSSPALGFGGLDAAVALDRAAAAWRAGSLQ